MKKLLFLIVLFSLQSGFGQDLVNELNGFKLHQFREVLTSEFKKPLQQKTFDDGFEYELFLIKPDSSAYMIFEYPSWDKKIIWSIQLYGADAALNPKFKDVTMGISKQELVEKIGMPSNVKNMGAYGELLKYENTNYSFEINQKNKLASIKITDDYLDYFPEPDIKKIPPFKTIKDALLNKNNQEISKWLSPGIEIYHNNKTMFFKHSWRSEIAKDASGIFSLIKKIAKGLENVDSSNIDEYEENMRFSKGQNVKHVLKFKKHPHIKEIVLKWEFGKYLIWEIKT